MLVDYIVSYLAIIYSISLFTFVWFPAGFFTYLAAGMVGITIAFISHELLHRSQKGEYKLAWPLLLATLALPLVTFGRVFWPIPGHKEAGDPKRVIQAPLINLAIMIGLLGIFSDSVIRFIGFINGWFALANLVPLSHLDGLLIYKAFPKTWAGMFSVNFAFILVYLAGVLPAEIHGFFTVFSGIVFLILFVLVIMIVIMGLMGIRPKNMS